MWMRSWSIFLSSTEHYPVTEAEKISATRLASLLMKRDNRSPRGEKWKKLLCQSSFQITEIFWVLLLTLVEVQLICHLLEICVVKYRAGGFDGKKRKVTEYQNMMKTAGGGRWLWPPQWLQKYLHQWGWYHRHCHDYCHGCSLFELGSSYASYSYSYSYSRSYEDGRDESVDSVWW